MCGIAGVLTAYKTDDHFISGGLQRMTDALERRGPDDESLIFEPYLELGFRRLAVVGGQEGKQPITSSDNTLILVTNGEVYNYKELRQQFPDYQFKGTSDTEVILPLYKKYGLDAFSLINGMFACALWDRINQSLLLVRDRIGIKPLFYHGNRERVIFASELKSLFAYPDCPRKFDWASALANPWLSEDLIYSEAPPSSFFSDIEAVPAGGYVRISRNSLRAIKGHYWKFPTETQEDLLFSEQLVTEYREMLIASCRDCLEGESTPGIMLSGGVDSASIAAIAKHEGIAIETFTVLCQSTLGNGDAEIAHQLSDDLLFENHQVMMDWDENTISPDLWTRILAVCENPSCGPEQLYKYFLLRYVRDSFPDLRVMLTGQGSDEFNGGYSKMLALDGRPTWSNAQRSIRTIQHHTYHRLLKDRFVGWEQDEQLLRTHYLGRLAGRTKESSDPWIMYQRSKIHDLEIFNLWHEDRISSHFGMEGRVPFLDHRVIEVCGKVPPCLRRQLFWDKEILRSAISPYLPAKYTRREKVPFFYGNGLHSTQKLIVNLLQQNEMELVERAFPKRSDGRSIVNFPALQRAILELSRSPDSAFQLLRLVNMGLLAERAREDGLSQYAATHPNVYRIRTAWPAIQAFTQKNFCIANEMDCVLQRAPHFRIVKDLDSGDYHLISNGEVQQHWTSADWQWMQLLQGFDGQRTTDELLEIFDIKESMVRDHIENGLRDGFLVIIRSDSTNQFSRAANLLKEENYHE